MEQLKSELVVTYCDMFCIYLVEQNPRTCVVLPSMDPSCYSAVAIQGVSRKTAGLLENVSGMPSGCLCMWSKKSASKMISTWSHMLGFVLFPWSFMPNLPQLLSTVISCLIVSLGESARASVLLNLGDMTRPVHVLITTNHCHCAQENIWDSSNPPNVLPGLVFWGPIRPLTLVIPIFKSHWPQPFLVNNCSCPNLIWFEALLHRFTVFEGLGYTTRLFPNDNNKIMLNI